jgi:hypothetical protein
LVLITPPLNFRLTVEKNKFQFFVLQTEFFLTDHFIFDMWRTFSNADNFICNKTSTSTTNSNSKLNVDIIFHGNVPRQSTVICKTIFHYFHVILIFIQLLLLIVNYSCRYTSNCYQMFHDLLKHKNVRRASYTHTSLDVILTWFVFLPSLNVC